MFDVIFHYVPTGVVDVSGNSLETKQEYLSDSTVQTFKSVNTKFTKVDKSNETKSESSNIINV